MASHHINISLNLTSAFWLFIGSFGSNGGQSTKVSKLLYLSDLFSSISNISPV